MVLVFIDFIRWFNKVFLNFPASWENEVLLNARFYLFHLFNYKSVISWRDVTPILPPDSILSLLDEDNDTLSLLDIPFF